MRHSIPTRILNVAGLLFVLACGGEGSVSGPGDLAESPGPATVNQWAGSGPASSRGVPLEEPQVAPDARSTSAESEPFYDTQEPEQGTDSEGETGGTNSQDAATGETEVEQDPWAEMAGFEGVITLSDVDSDLDEDANIATMIAAFGMNAIPAVPAATLGPCALIEGSDASAPPSIDAGNIGIDGTLYPYTLTHNEETQQYEVAGSIFGGDIFPETGTLSVAGTGSEQFPAFSIAMPVPPRVLIQGWKLDGSETISTSSPLTVSWTPAAGEWFVNVFVAGLSASGDVMPGSQVSCTLSGNDPGTLTVPSEALQQISYETIPFAGGYFLIGVSRGAEGTASDSPLPVQATAIRSTGGIIGVN